MRAFDPWPGVFTMLAGKGAQGAARAAPPARPATVQHPAPCCGVDDAGVIVACGGGHRLAPARSAAREPAGDAGGGVRGRRPPRRRQPVRRMSGASPRAPRRRALIHATVRGGVTLAERWRRRSGALDTRDRDFLQELVSARCAIAAPSTPRSPLPSTASLEVDPPSSTPAPRRATRCCACACRTAPPSRSRWTLAREVAPRAAGFVNAVLRRLARGAPTGATRSRSRIRWLAHIEGSLPPWLAQRWLQRAGPEDAVARARAFLEPSPTYLRLNPRLPEAADAVSAAGVLLQAGEVPARSWSPAAARRISLQPASSMSRTKARSSSRTSRRARTGAILDACAAPGGKATLLADLGAHARITALEPSLKRLAVLQRTVQRWGAGASIAVLGGDALRLPLRTAFDVVLLDAPCTGLGTIARRPDLRWRVTQADVDRHAARQRRMLAAVSAVVKPGGRLVYSTCSLEPDETSDVVKSFLASGAPFALTPPQHVPQSLRGAEPWLRLLPERRGGDGFFVASFTRQG